MDWRETVQVSVTLIPTKTNDSHKDGFKRRFTLTAESPSMHIGRGSKRPRGRGSPSASNALFESPIVSRRHAEIYVDRTCKNLYIRDLDSMHGTLVNGDQILGARKLESGDLVTVGQTVTQGNKTFAHRSFRVHYLAVPRKDRGGAAAPVPRRATHASNIREDAVESSNRSKGFSVPDASSNDDDSEYDSESEGESEQDEIEEIELMDQKPRDFTSHEQTITAPSREIKSGLSRASPLEIDDDAEEEPGDTTIANLNASESPKTNLDARDPYIIDTDDEEDVLHTTVSTPPATATSQDQRRRELFTFTEHVPVVDLNVEVTAVDDLETSATTSPNSNNSDANQVFTPAYSVASSPMSSPVQAREMLPGESNAKSAAQSSTTRPLQLSDIVFEYGLHESDVSELEVNDKAQQHENQHKRVFQSGDGNSMPHIEHEPLGTAAPKNLEAEATYHRSTVQPVEATSKAGEEKHNQQSRHSHLEAPPFLLYGAAQPQMPLTAPYSRSGGQYVTYAEREPHPFYPVHGIPHYPTVPVQNPILTSLFAPREPLAETNAADGWSVPSFRNSAADIAAAHDWSTETVPTSANAPVEQAVLDVHKTQPSHASRISISELIRSPSPRDSTGIFSGSKRKFDHADDEALSTSSTQGTNATYVTAHEFTANDLEAPVSMASPTTVTALATSIACQTAPVVSAIPTTALKSIEHPPANKRRRLAASAGTFLLGAVIGGVGVFGALLSIPDSMF